MTASFFLSDGETRPASRSEAAATFIEPLGEELGIRQHPLRSPYVSSRRHILTPLVPVEFGLLGPELRCVATVGPQDRLTAPRWRFSHKCPGVELDADLLAIEQDVYMGRLEQELVPRFSEDAGAGFGLLNQGCA